jgi:hypothetical protein
MLQVLTDEEAIAHADELVERVAQAIASTRLLHPAASVDALFQVLFMVNGKNWMGATDMARARVRARALGPSDT